jgi:hypothetical protein
VQETAAHLLNLNRLSFRIDDACFSARGCGDCSPLAFVEDDMFVDA